MMKGYCQCSDSDDTIIIQPVAVSWSFASRCQCSMFVVWVGGGQGGQTNHGMLGVVQSSFLCQRKILTTDNYISTPSLFIFLLIIHLFASCCFCWFSLLLLYFNFCCQTCLFSVLLALNGHIEKMQLYQCQQVCFILITNRTQVACT